ncbi:MAG: sugar phosphate isomerase/epimerase [Clostridia bacterium]|nr:sugar phosphate isomerase/epimerase [Clostridia bacterium]
MKTGISTASLFVRKNTEQAMQFLNENKVQTCEVFLESYCEYSPDFIPILKKYKGELDVHSIHTLTTQFEPQLYSINERARADSFKLLDSTMQVANAIGARYYTFHGVARLKRTQMNIDFDRVAKYTNQIIETCNKYGVDLAYENVHWAYYNYLGFFKKLKSLAPKLKATLDVKQARQSQLDYRDLINEMGKDIVTVHLSDINSDGKMCLPGSGVTDFSEMFNRLKDVGFDGSLILEVYKDDFDSYDQLFNSLEFIKELAYKIF